MARKDIRRSPRGQRREPDRAAPSGWRAWVRRLFVWGVAAVLLVAVVTAIAVGVAASSLPSFSALKSSQQGQMIVVRARDGSELFTQGPSYGRWVRSADIPQVMKDAMVATEDRRFYSHIGIDPIGLLRASAVAVKNTDGLRATSTITQQLARNVFLNNSRSLGRKVREMVLAMALETRFSKDQILELYLNKVYFGGGAYGIDSASRKFFNHPATELTLPEAAIVAGLVKAPSHYAPTADAEAGRDRARVVLRLMAQNGKISWSEAEAADLDAVRLAPETGQNSVRYFTDWALPQLDVLLGESTEPIEVWTTLDPKLQSAGIDALKANAPGGAQGALVSLDRDGAVLALVGGTDYVSSNYNRATNAMRQPGSAWKLFVYLSALEAGYRPEDMVTDEPVTINGWSPRNDGRSYAGKINVRTAFAYSKNTVAAQLGNEVGFSTVAGMARRLGITTPISTYPSMVLGSNDVRVLDMTRAFATVSAKGHAIEPYGIVKVTTTDGQLLYQHRPSAGAQLVPDYVAAEMTDLLQSAVQIGTGRAAQIGRPVAGKTGTTSSNKDGWFLGFSSGVTTGVWMGRDDAKTVPGLQGGTAPARAFAQFMKVATATRPVEPFDTQAKAPEWQLEPDDQAQQGANPEDYYYVDDSGRLVDPRPPAAADDQPQPADEPAQQDADRPPAAAGDDFLNRATGRDEPAPAPTRSPPPRRTPAVQGPVVQPIPTATATRRPPPAQF
ncbi:PBP1A family penicillin-binding protein [Parablastomonas sp. CN1-191]|uniref:transglycosylase domain-containing protein n=1 Tax=Parablastomonas sp. CN1-191 TaxID=3400908 RepID=UPI003BF7A923